MIESNNMENKIIQDCIVQAQYNSCKKEWVREQTEYLDGCCIEGHVFVERIRKAKEREFDSTYKICQVEKLYAQKLRFPFSPTTTSFRKATEEDYWKWLKGYILKNGCSSLEYSKGKFEKRDDWYTAIEDCYITPLYGASSINIIIPEGIKIKNVGWEAGHNNIFIVSNYLGDFIHVGFDSVVIFKDIEKCGK